MAYPGREAWRQGALWEDLTGERATPVYAASPPFWRFRCTGPDAMFVVPT